ncbi:hypothetical protein TRFO_01036 [Tritrichomonas foetus]|uniref:Uncharacterized protein n=1 Tax=Tritrichomonas foetus TaxID=1144522 RepID=A0A1J4KJM8_9EUKA|nr:hypothetical protein TRFO_01036 [Tritrichomonas foetus]|eukprot:OHT11144.1 hypothetical protein TRFO_01036 [Tritrichomonas foetus]
MHHSNTYEKDKAAILLVLTNLSEPLYNYISNLIKNNPCSNSSNCIRKELIHYLNYLSPFSTQIDTLIKKCVSLLILNPNECFPGLFSYIKQTNLEPKSKFSKTKLLSSHYLTRLDSEYPDPSFTFRCIAYFVIDKLFATIFQQLLDRIQNNPNFDLNHLFNEYFFFLMDERDENALILKNINNSIWSKVVHVLSILKPNETFLLFVDIFSIPQRKEHEFIFSYNFFRSISTVNMHDSGIDSFSQLNHLIQSIESIFQQTSTLNEIHLSASLFLMNLIASILINNNQISSKFLPIILKLVTKSLTTSPAALPIAVVFLKFGNKLKIQFSSGQIISSALDHLNYTTGSISLILHTFSQLLSHNSFNDIYYSGIKFLPNLINENDIQSSANDSSEDNANSITSRQSLIPFDRAQKVFQRIISFGSFNHVNFELVNFLVQFAAFDFPNFVKFNLKEFNTPIFLKFNATAIFDFFRYILIDDSLKFIFPDAFEQFQKNIKNLFSLYVKTTPSKIEAVIYSTPTFEKIEKNHILEQFIPNSVSFSQCNTKLKNDISIWAKLYCGKRTYIFEEYKSFQNCRNCSYQKENQPISSLFSLIPLIEENDDFISHIIPFIFSFSPQISAISVYVIRDFLIKKPTFLIKVVDVIINDEIESIESFYNLLSFLDIFFDACLNSPNYKNDPSVIDFQEIFYKIEQIIIISLCSNYCEIRTKAFSIIDKLNIKYFDVECFRTFSKKLNYLLQHCEQKLNIDDLPHRSYREIALSHFEILHSIYFSVMIEQSDIKLNNYHFINKACLKLKQKLNELNTKSNNQSDSSSDATFKNNNVSNSLIVEKSNDFEYLFYMNLLTLVSLKDESSNSQELIDAFHKIKDKTMLCSYASSLKDILAITSIFKQQPLIMLTIALIIWQRFPNDDTISTFLNISIKIINDLPVGILKRVENEKDDSKVVISILKLLAKMFNHFSKEHEKSTSGPYLRRFLSEDAFIYFKCENFEEDIFDFCLNAAVSEIYSLIGKKALEMICKVTSLYEKPLRYFDVLKKFPNAMNSIIGQSPQFIDYLFDQIKFDESAISILSSVFKNFATISEGTDLLIEKINSSLIETSDIEFTKLIYGLTGRILAVALWNFPSFESLNILKNVIISMIFIKKTTNKKFIKENVLKELFTILDSQENDFDKLNILLSDLFQFCLDQFLKEAFSLLSNEFDLKHKLRFIQALKYWLEKVKIDDLNSDWISEKHSLSLSPETESCFYCLPSYLFVEIFCSLDLLDLSDSLIRNNANSLLILGIHQKQAKLITRIIQILPEKIDFISHFFGIDFWRYQVCQLGKYGVKYFNEITADFLDTFNSEKTTEDETNYANDFSNITDFLLQQVLPTFIFPCTFDDADHISHLLFKLYQRVSSFCVAFQNRDSTKALMNDFPMLIRYVDFDCLFAWATKCGDLEASYSAVDFLINNFDCFLENQINSQKIEIVMETITILVLAINEKNNVKSTKITGDNDFSYTPYYKYIASMIKLLTQLNLTFTNQQLQNKNIMNNDSLIGVKELNSKVFWFICEFIEAADKDFGPIFANVTDSLYQHALNYIPKICSFAHFEGIFNKLTKHDAVISQNCLPNSFDNVVFVAKYLFVNKMYKALIGCDYVNGDKGAISTVFLFLIPFVTSPQDEIITHAYRLLNLEKEPFLDNQDQNSKQNCIHELVNTFISSFDISFLPILLKFYLFVVKYSPHSSYISNVYDVCTSILNSLGNSIEIGLFSRLINIILRNRSEYSSKSACLFLEAFRKYGEFNNVVFPPHDPRFPVNSLVFDIFKYEEKANLYFPVEYSFLSLDFIQKIREKCSNLKIQPFSKWDEKCFKAELSRDDLHTDEVSSDIIKFNGEDVDNFLMFIRNLLNNNKKMTKFENQISHCVSKCNDRYNSQMTEEESKLLFVDPKLFTPDKDEILTIGSPEFPLRF